MHCPYVMCRIVYYMSVSIWVYNRWIDELKYTSWFLTYLFTQKYILFPLKIDSAFFICLSPRMKPKYFTLNKHSRNIFWMNKHFGVTLNDRITFHYAYMLQCVSLMHIYLLLLEFSMVSVFIIFNDKYSSSQIFTYFAKKLTRIKP